ncbi:MAG: hypothetical protein U5N86_04120 [Planctomycetota bacterium]|nr:hypothetical protein [Planctomycetota bacterium]
MNREKGIDLEQMKQEDSRTLKKGKLLLGGTAAFVVLVLVIAALTYSGGDNGTVLPSVSQENPESAFAEGDYDARVLAVMAMKLSQKSAAGERLPSYPRQQLVKLIELYSRAGDGFRSAKTILELYGMLPDGHTVFLKFLSAAVSNLSTEQSRDRWASVENWLEAFAPEGLKDISAYQKHFAELVKLAADAPSSADSRALSVVSELAKLAVELPGSRGTANEFCKALALEAFAREPGALIHAAQAWADSSPPRTSPSFTAACSTKRPRLQLTGSF